MRTGGEGSKDRSSAIESGSRRVRVVAIVSLARGDAANPSQADEISVLGRKAWRIGEFEFRYLLVGQGYIAG